MTPAELLNDDTFVLLAPVGLIVVIIVLFLLGVGE